MTVVPIKLGIACVYFYGKDDVWLLDLQLRYIKETTGATDYTIYAGAARLQEHLKRQLQSIDQVRVIDLPTFSGTGNREHAYYLNLLVRAAVEDGCTHVATLDADSFPVLEDWPSRLIDALGESRRFAAVHRTENLDTFLPHPSGCFMSRSFVEEYDPDFLPSDSEQSSSKFQEFLAATNQRSDTGIGYAFHLWKNQEPWLRLERSNMKDLHCLMAGIYGGVFFHVGASSRSPTFSGEARTLPSMRFGKHFGNLPVLWRITFLIEQRYQRQNTRIAKRIRARLKSEPEAFLAELAGDDPTAKSGSPQNFAPGSASAE
jgi:hypothetical protein